MSRLKFLTKYAVDGVHYDSGSEIDKALNGNFYERMSAIKHPNVTSEHIHKALNDGDIDVRVAAIRYPKATNEHISKALNDDSAHVRRFAIQNPNATNEHISKALNDDIGFVRETAERIKRERNL